MTCAFGITHALRSRSISAGSLFHGTSALCFGISAGASTSFGTPQAAFDHLSASSSLALHSGVLQDCFTERPCSTPRLAAQRFIACHSPQSAGITGVNELIRSAATLSSRYVNTIRSQPFDSGAHCINEHALDRRLFGQLFQRVMRIRCVLSILTEIVARRP
jgi:hypothetical protein